MSETERDYEVGRGKPPVRSRFQQGSVRQPARTAPEKLAGAAGRRVTQLVNKSTCVDLRATKMLIDMLKDAGRRPA
jgi:hypothetical protein